MAHAVRRKEASYSKLRTTVLTSILTSKQYRFSREFSREKIVSGSKTEPCRSLWKGTSFEISRRIRGLFALPVFRWCFLSADLYNVPRRIWQYGCVRDVCV